jgi:hypothetical protein
MKKLYSLILITVFLMLSLGGISQPPPPPSNPSTTPAGNAPVGQANAPIGNGTLILLLLAAAYGGRKVYVLHSQPEVQ